MDGVSIDTGVSESRVVTGRLIRQLWVSVDCCYTTLYSVALRLQLSVSGENSWLK